MAKKQQVKRFPIWVVPIAFGLICFFGTLIWKSVSEKSLEKRQAYVLAREAFKVMHPEADLPLAAKDLAWTEEGSDKFILEADGAKVIGGNRTPARWIVNLRHEGGQWMVDESHWK